jgi:hypothetical protein
MIDMLIGVAIGAAFAPFWMMVFHKAKDMIMGTKQHPTE